MANEARVKTPDEIAGRRVRQRLRSNIDGAGSALGRISNGIHVYEGEEDHAWPVTEEIPYAVSAAIQAVHDAIHALDVALAEAQRAYRARVLEWLLAETIAQTKANYA